MSTEHPGRLNAWINCAETITEIDATTDLGAIHGAIVMLPWAGRYMVEDQGIPMFWIVKVETLGGFIAGYTLDLILLDADRPLTLAMMRNGLNRAFRAEVARQAAQS